MNSPKLASRHRTGMTANVLALAIFAAATTLHTTAIAAADSGLVAICGSTCTEDGNGDPLCHWAPASPGQACKAKGICSPSECTVWWTAQAPKINVLRITPAQAKRLPGARTYKGARPPSR